VNVLQNVESPGVGTSFELEVPTLSITVQDLKLLIRKTYPIPPDLDLELTVEDVVVIDSKQVSLSLTQLVFGFTDTRDCFCKIFRTSKMLHSCSECVG